LSITFVEVDAKKIYDDILITFQTALGEVLYPGDERRIFLEQEVQLIIAIYNAINESAKQNLLRYARGAVLDAIGESKDVIRLEAQKAICTVRFTLSAAQSTPMIIPKGTRTTPDGVYFFETVSEKSISSGELYVDIECMATTAGASHNGFSPGQINALVDIIPFIGQVSNIDVSSGGADIEADDDGMNVWSGYRERIRLASAKISTAGHELGYIYYAKSADANIQDVIATSPSPGEVLITVLMKDGELPSEAVLAKVEASCNPKHVRPQTDFVVAAAPEVIPYTIQLTYYINADNQIEESNIRAAVDEAIEAYKAWQDTKIGRHINPDKLRQVLLNAGASRILLAAPTYTELDAIQIAKAGTVMVTYGGLE
jgi:phage-related baseplate assembly protein